jgi:2-polyprenyl-3-methyl-5-hydroxy-6-metoxy-1,4-benzoquinol methylase
MIESILTEAARTDFDFRPYANPGDPLISLFQEWIPYYRLKFAIAKVLQPKAILEIGVRFGYSANAFLQAAPAAEFLGVDLDCDRFGGQQGALDWARKITSEFKAEFLVADTQAMDRFPGGIYDLIHVDGQQDGGGTFHDLRRAVEQTRWILLDGYFWTQDNFLNANDFLVKYKDVIRYSIAIPGYAGELLIRVSDEHLQSMARTPAGARDASSAIRDFYSSDYYLKDCGGYVGFRESGGKQITDNRLLSMLALASLTPGSAVLELGCGRGEMAYQLAVRGSEVTAVDYATASIELAQKCFEAESEELRSRVRFICADAAKMEFDRKFDTVIAGDLIEHLSPTEVEQLYAMAARHLEPEGMFIIHTFPNLWFYKRGQARLRRAAARIGAFLPAEPRTRYELLMHINEQSPAVLRRTLLKAFEHVYVWVGSPEEPARYLGRKCKISELTGASDVYALASHSPIDLSGVRQRLTPTRLPSEEYGKVSFSSDGWPISAKPGSSFQVSVMVTNNSGSPVTSMPPNPVNFSYHWVESETNKMAVFDGLRTPIPGALLPGTTSRVVVTVRAPAETGAYKLLVTLVQEGRAWFNDVAESAVAIEEISIE